MWVLQEAVVGDGVAEDPGELFPPPASVGPGVLFRGDGGRIMAL